MARSFVNVINTCYPNNRESRTNGKTERFAIETDHQLQLELPSISNGNDKLQRKCTELILIDTCIDVL